MTSKISYIKLIREDIRHRGWLVALTSVALLLGMPVYSMLYLDSYLGTEDGYFHWAEEMRNMMPGMVNGYRATYVAFVIVVAGALIALTGFAYIHSRERSDFYHALPLKRRQWFAVSYLSGMVIFLAPYLICCVLTVGVGCIYKVMTPGLAAEMAFAAVGGICAFFIVYHTCILAAMLTGQTVTGLLASLVICVYPMLVFGLLSMLKANFFESYTNVGFSFSDRLAELASPVGAVIGVIRTTALGSFSLTRLVSVLLLILALLIGSILLYRFYPAEAAGNPLSFSNTAPVFKSLICIPTALFVGIMAANFTGSSGMKRWLFFLCILAAVLLCAIVEFIYQQDMKMLLKGWRSSLLCIAAVALILGIFEFDVFGYDGYIPKEDKVESMSFQPDSFYAYFDYPDNGDSGQYEDHTMYGVFTENISPLYALAEEGVESLENGITPQNVYSGSGADDSQDYIRGDFFYKLKSGRVVSRQYCVKKESIASALEELCADEAYRKELFPVFSLDRDEITDVSLLDIYGVPEKMDLNKTKTDELLDVYEKDVLAADIKMLEEETPIAQFWIERTVPDGTGIVQNVNGQAVYAEKPYESTQYVESLQNLYIYESYVNTLAYLKENGYTIRTEIDPKDVSSVTIYLSDDVLDSGVMNEMLSELSDDAEYTAYPDMDDEVTVRSTEDIAIVAEHIRMINEKLLGDYSRDMVYAEVHLKEDEGVLGYELE